MYKSLQAGRAIAAIFVVFFHLGYTMAEDKYFGISAFFTPVSFGNAGIEFFFVLSGFIIYFAHRGDISCPHRLFSYIRKRFLRIYPTYWIVFVAMFFFAMISSKSASYDPYIIFKSLLLVPLDKKIVGGTGAPVLIVAWTLQYEMFFYASFASVIVNKFCGSVLVVVFTVLYFHYGKSSDLPFPLSFLLSDYMWLFIMGMIISMVSALYKISIRNALLCSGIGIVLFIFVAANKVTGNALLVNWEILLYGVAFSLIVLGLVQAENNGRLLLRGQWMQKIGGASYVLYLIHYPLISVLCKISVFLHIQRFGVIGALLSFIVMFVLCLAVSVTFHVWIEKPIILRFKERNAVA